MNKYFALVQSVGDGVEEEVTLSLNDLNVTCFASVCPYEIHEGEKYPVSFNLMIFDDYEVYESEGEEVGLERIGKGFSYWIKGRIEKGVIDCGIQFEDEILLSDYGYLDDKCIRLKVDRIDVEFLEEQQSPQMQAWPNTPKVGSIIVGKVLRHEPYGIFLDIGYEHEGLIQITDFKDEGTMKTSEYPVIDDEVRAVVLGFKDHGCQVWLGLKPSQLSSATKQKP